MPILPISCKFSNIINCLLLSIVLKFRILSRCLTVINIPCGDFVSEMLSATSSLICTILQLSLSRLIHSGYFSAAAAVKYAFSPNAHPLLTASTASFAPSHTKYPVCLRYFLCSVSLRYSFIYVFCLDVISIFLLNTQFLDFCVSLC